MSSSSEKSQLPLPDYDHIPQGTLASRISALDADGVAALLAYERQHGNRLPVVQVLEHRVSALQSGDAQPSGSLDQTMPEVSGNSGGSPVSPATAGPVINPPSHGDPTNPAMPR